MPSVKQLGRNSLSMIMPNKRRRRSQVVTMSFDDDASVSSTISVDRNVPEHEEVKGAPLVIVAPSSITTKKSVRFDEASNESYDNTVMCKEDTKDLWYSPEDHVAMKATNSELAKEIMRSERQNPAIYYSYIKVIQRLFDTCLGEEEEEEEVVLMSDDEHLQKWLACATSRIGLERKAVRSIDKDRYYRRKDLVRAVLEIQEMDYCIEEGNSKDELIAKSSGAITLPSRLFAQELALAQAAAYSC